MTTHLGINRLRSPSSALAASSALKALYVARRPSYTLGETALVPIGFWC